MLDIYRKQFKRKTPPVKYPEGVGGREVCSDTPLGKREYKRRTEVMWERQKGLCSICGTDLRQDEATYEHSIGRGMNGGHRDDRIEIDGKPYNSAAHGLCNGEKGSRRVA